MATTSGKQKYRFYDSQEYYPHLCEQIKQTKAGDRVLLCTLWILAEEPLVADILEQAKAAAKRGVEVILLTDAFMFLIKGGLVPGPSYFFGEKTRLLTKSFRNRYAVLRELEEAGIKYMIINQPRRAMVWPFRDRSHMKYSVVNDTVFIGGCNLGNSYFIDMMVGWEDKSIADWLDKFTRDILANGSALKALGGEDQSIKVDSKTRLIVDAGKVDQSIILDKAFEIIDQAREKLLITYQYFPQGSTVGHLTGAVRRGVRLRVYYNHQSQHPLPLNMVYGTMAWKMRKNGPPEFSTHRLPKKHAYLHDKVVASEKAAVLSSHNYSITGVEYGTAEIGLVSTDPEFVRGVTETVDKQLGKSLPSKSVLRA